MGKMKKLAPILLGMMVVATGCGRSGDKIIETALENMGGIENYTLVADTELITDIEGKEEVAVRNVEEVKGTLKPQVALSITDTTNLKSNTTDETEDAIRYVFSEEEKIAYYEKQNDKWYKLTVDGMDMLGDTIKKPNNLAKKFTMYINQYEMGEDITLEGKPCYNIKGTVNSEHFEDVLEVLNSIQNLGLNEEAEEAMSENQEIFGGIIIQNFVEKETGKLVEQRVDLGAMMQIGLQEAFESQGSNDKVNSVECNMKITYKDINATNKAEKVSDLNNAELID